MIAPGIKYYRINQNNTGIATTNNGVGSSSPTEELTAPTAAGTYSSGDGTTTITNQTVGAFSALAVGQYLYYIDGSTGDYVLMGQIEAIPSPFTTVTLTANSTGSPTAGDVLAGSFSLITITEAIYIRIPTDLTSVPQSVVIPNFSLWRTSGDNTNGVNNTNITSLDQISAVGAPLVDAPSVVPIPFTIRTMNNFTFGTGNNSQKAWPSPNAYPKYMWIRVTPVTTTNTLASKTLYRWTTQEAFDGVVCSSGVNGPTVTQLQGWGYNTTGSTAPSGGN